MHRQRRRERPEERTEPRIGSYHELHFATVAEGVAYCQRIVPHVVPPFGSVSEGQPSRIAVWLHVPRRPDATLIGCFLYLSEGVREALERVGQMPRTTGTISRVALPDTSVLVFGQDHQDERRGSVSPLNPPKHPPRILRYEDVLAEVDAILR